jgi:hypothetical protein
MSKVYDPGKRKRCVNVAWRLHRKVRILECPWYQGKMGTIENVAEHHVLVRITLGKKPGQWDIVKYPPGSLRLI